MYGTGKMKDTAAVVHHMRSLAARARKEARPSPARGEARLAQGATRPRSLRRLRSPRDPRRADPHGRPRLQRSRQRRARRARRQQRSGQSNPFAGLPTILVTPVATLKAKSHRSTPRLSLSHHSWQRHRRRNTQLARDIMYATRVLHLKQQQRAEERGRGVARRHRGSRERCSQTRRRRAQQRCCGASVSVMAPTGAPPRRLSARA